jgi:hypothetical protein
MVCWDLILLINTCTTAIVHALPHTLRSKPGFVGTVEENKAHGGAVSTSFPNSSLESSFFFKRTK